MKKKDNSNKGLFIKRVVAFIFDIILISVLVSFICSPFLDYDSIANLNENATEILVDYSEGNINTETYISSASSILFRLARKQGLISLITIILNVLYFIVYQFYNNGQTVGKKILGIKVISNDSSELTFDNYIYRSFIINSILIDMLVFILLIFASQDLYISGAGLLGIINFILIFICGFMIIFNKEKRGLHDLVGNTRVVVCRK